MDVKEAIYARRSIRKYQSKPVSDEDIITLIKYATAAPSAHNQCPWQFYVIQDPTIQTKLRMITPYTRAVAPVYIVVGANVKRVQNDFWVQDCSAAIENLLIGATSLGLGTCWMGVYPDLDQQKNLKQLIGNADFIPMSIIALGYPEGPKEPRDQFDPSMVEFLK